jgi:hypothetical protein
MEIVGVIEVNTRLKYTHEWTSYSCSPYQNVDLVKISEFYDVLMEKYQKKHRKQRVFSKSPILTKTHFWCFQKNLHISPKF